MVAWSISQVWYSIIKACVHATRWTNLLPNFVQVMSKLASLAAISCMKVQRLILSQAHLQKAENWKWLQNYSVVMCYQELHRSPKRKLIHVKAAHLMKAIRSFPAVVNLHGLMPPKGLTLRIVSPSKVSPSILLVI